MHSHHIAATEEDIEMGDDESRGRRAKQAVKYIESDDDEEESDSENEVIKPKKAPASKKATPAKKAVPVKKSSSSSKKKRHMESSDEDESDDDDDSSGDDSSDNDSDDNAGSDDGEEDSKPTKKRAAPKSAKKAKNPKKKARAEQTPKSLKALTRVERLEEARRAYKWWEAKELPNGLMWRKLEHAGILFAPPYEKHNVPLLYDGKPVELTSEEEEIATFFAGIPEDGPQLGNPKTRDVFRANFFADFRTVLTPGHVIKKLEKCDFSRIKAHLDMQRSLKKAASDEEKAMAKKEKEEITLKYGYALIDGRIEKMGNYNMEPPGLFRGRGEHPRTGALKQRCFAESVDINVSVDACVPRCALPGHAWASVRHDPHVTWLAGWQENVQQQHKYVMLAASSSFKGKSDLEKYDKAIRLAKHIDRVRRDYTAKIRNKDKATRQMGTAMWVIDVLALRVGGEKNEDEADTVGCCSLRVEHLTFVPPAVSGEESFELELEFLGKDSMLFKQTINFAIYGDIGKKVFSNLQSFCAGKKAGEEVFNTLTPTVLNKHLTSIMPGLTAKVFRTYNASVTLEKELPSEEELRGLTVQEKMVRYNAANRQVAILCNHQKTVSKSTEVMFENLYERLETLKSQRRDLIKWKEMAKKGKKIPIRGDDSDAVEAIAENLREAHRRKERASSDAEKLAAADALAEAKARQKEDQKRRYQEKHMFKQNAGVGSIDAKITRWDEDIRKMETDIRNRDENKEVALGTSKINYMDPRISVAWCKRCEVPIDKVFAKTLRDKFNWAMAVPPEWKFEPKKK